MSAANVFLSPRLGLSRSDAWDLAKESAPGVVLVGVLGLASLRLSELVPQVDPLVAAIVLGMLARLLLGSNERIFFRILPGMLVAQSVFIPLGIILYGNNLQIKALLATDRLVFVQVIGLVLLTFVVMCGLGRLRWFGIKHRMLYMLGFGSAVCGAAAITITSPITECEPDDTAAGLVDNTIAVILGVSFIAVAVRPILAPKEFAALAGAVLLQTGFVRTALEGFPASLVAFGLAVKSLRIALLVISIPTVTYVLRRQIVIPWYLILFIAAGFLFTYVPLPPEVTKSVVTYYNLFFTAAIASVGLNADIRKVSLRLFKPLVLVLLVFAVDVAAFMATRGFIHY